MEGRRLIDIRDEEALDGIEPRPLEQHDVVANDKLRILAAGRSSGRTRGRSISTEGSFSPWGGGPGSLSGGEPDGRADLNPCPFTIGPTFLRAGRGRNFSPEVKQ